MSFPAWGAVILALGVAAAVAIAADLLYNYFTRQPFNPAMKHCLITGGSTGLGKAFAIELVKRGANVTIVARRQSELDIAALAMNTHKIHRDQRIVTVSADVTKHKDVVRAFDEARAHMGGDPEIICCCAGAAFPKLFLDHTIEDFEYLTHLNYLGQVHVAHEGVRRIRDAAFQKTKLIFVSSIGGLISFAGYSAYSPTKYALRGLADSLRNELKMYGIQVHLFLPGNIDSPGFVTENLTKPHVTKVLEGLSDPMPAIDCAKTLIKGLDAGHYMITTEFVGQLLRSAARGVNPSNSYIIDSILSILCQTMSSGTLSGQPMCSDRSVEVCPEWRSSVTLHSSVVFADQYIE